MDDEAEVSSRYTVSAPRHRHLRRRPPPRAAHVHPVHRNPQYLRIDHGDLREEDSEEGGAGTIVVLGEDHVGDAVDDEDVFLSGGYTEECVVSIITVSRNDLFEGQ